MKIRNSLGIADRDVEDGDPAIQSVLPHIVGQRRADFRHRFNGDNLHVRVDRRCQNGIYSAVGTNIYEATRLPKSDLALPE